ncbi:MAG: GntR family transcriptional regulator [Acidobacteriota bacterium]
MMRLWLSRNSAASLREQLVTQITLGVLSGDLGPGEKLPSVRELARRYDVHSNTVSAAYRDLAGREWLDFRKGSGIYVRDLRAEPPVVGSELEQFVGAFLKEARARGFSASEVGASVNRVLSAEPVRRLVVAEPEPELCRILVAELQGHCSLPVAGVVLGHRLPPAALAGAAVASLMSRADALRAALPVGVPYHLLRVRSVPEHLMGQVRPPADALIGVASCSPEILRRVRTLLSAAALDPGALEFRDAREQGWSRGLTSCSFVIADAVTVRKLPKKCASRVLRVLSEASLEELREFLTLVTQQKVS